MNIHTQNIFVPFILEKMSLCRLGHPRTLSLHQVDLKLRDAPVPASLMLGLKACDITVLPKVL